MESDNEKQSNTREKSEKGEINISHEDLSDVSDLEDSMGGNSEEEGRLRGRDDLNNTTQKQGEDDRIMNGEEQKTQVTEKKVTLRGHYY